MERRPLLPVHPEPREALPIISSDQEAPTTLHSIRNAVLLSPLNILLLVSPPAVIVWGLGWGDGEKFLLNLMAIIPLGRLIGVATEEFSLRCGLAFGALLNAMFGNAVALILGITALEKGLIRVVLASLLGSILSNLLLVLGTTFLIGGLHHVEQHFNLTGSQIYSPLLVLTILPLFIPAAFGATVALGDDGARRAEIILELSRGAAIVLLVVYGIFLVFRFGTHSDLYEEEYTEDEPPKLNLLVAVAVLFSATALVSLHTWILVGSIEGVVSQWHVSPTFVGVFLLSLATNAASYTASTTHALRNRVELGLSAAVGSTMQIGMLVAPIIVVIGWMTRKPMTLAFEGLELAVGVGSVLASGWVVQSGKANWFEGVMLLSAYTIIVLAFYFIPEKAQSPVLG